MFDLKLTITAMLRGRVLGVAEFTQDVVKIGRQPDNDIFIDNAVFSRLHAVIRRQGIVFTLEDHETANGTFVNGQRVKVWNLSDGDRISVGKYTLVVAIGTTGPAIPKLEVEGGNTMAVSQEAESPDALERRSAVRAYLVVSEPERRTYTIERDVFQIGKKAPCDVTLGGWFTPRKIALIARGYGGFSLVNVAGGRAVLLNGKPVPWQAWLREGDRVVASKLTAVFRTENPALETAPT